MKDKMTWNWNWFFFITRYLCPSCLSVCTPALWPLIKSDLAEILGISSDGVSLLPRNIPDLWVLPGPCHEMHGTLWAKMQVGFKMLRITWIVLKVFCSVSLWPLINSKQHAWGSFGILREEFVEESRSMRLSVCLLWGSFGHLFVCSLPRFIFSFLLSLYSRTFDQLWSTWWHEIAFGFF